MDDVISFIPVIDGQLVAASAVAIIPIVFAYSGILSCLVIYIATLHVYIATECYYQLKYLNAECAS